MTVIVQAEELRALYAELLRALGGDEREATLFADHFLIADLRGMEWQGLKSLDRHIVDPIRRGTIRLGQPVDVIRSSASTVVLNAHGGLGHVVCRDAMLLATDMAASTGIGMAVVRECGDTGLLAGYTTLALDRDCVGIAFNNTNPYVAPFGGAEPLLGIDPISAAVPAGEELPVVLDMAVARPRPAFDEDEVWEQPFTGPPLLFFETVREYALSILLELLCGGLAEMPIGADKSRRGECGAVLIAVHIPHFTAMASFTSMVDRYVRQLKDARPAAGTAEILLPGERGLREEARRREHGIPVRLRVWANTTRIAEDLSVDWRRLVTPVEVADDDS